MKQTSLIGFLILVFAVAVGIALSPLFQSSTQAVPLAQTKQTPSVRVLRLGHNTPTDSALHEASLKLAAMVHERTQGAVRIDVYPAQALGTDDEMIEMTREGKIDLLLTPTAKLSTLQPSMQYADLPFYFNDRAELYRMLDGDPGRMLLEEMRSMGLVGITFWENGFKQFTSNAPITHPDDFKGKKIRVMKSRLIMDQFRLLGAQPVSIDFHETAQALKDGVVEGQENPLVAIYSMGMYKHQKYLTLTDHAYLGYVLSMNDKIFDALPHEVRMALLTAAEEITPWEREQTKNKETLLLEAMKQSGIIIQTLTPQAREAFVKQLKPLASTYENIIGPHLLARTQVLKLLGDPKYQNAYFVGLSADLSASTKVAGLALKRGLELAAQEINAQGGILGNTVHILPMDHKSMASLGTRHIKELQTIPNVIGIVGGLHSVVAMSQKETFERVVPFMLPWAAASEVTQSPFRNVFRVSVTDGLASIVLAKQALKNGSKPWIVYEDSLWGAGAKNNITEYLRKEGVTEVATYGFSRGELFNAAEFAKTWRTVPHDVMIIIANPAEGDKIFAQIEGAQTPIVMHWGVLGCHFFAKHEAFLRHTDVTVLNTYRFTNRPVQRKLERAYRETYAFKPHEPIPALHGVAQAYDTLMMLSLAAKQARSVEGEKLVQALQKLPFYEGAIKAYHRPFGPDDFEALEIGDYYMGRFDAQGNLVPVKE